MSEVDWMKPLELKVGGSWVAVIRSIPFICRGLPYVLCVFNRNGEGEDWYVLAANHCDLRNTPSPPVELYDAKTFMKEWDWPTRNVVMKGTNTDGGVCLLHAADREGVYAIRTGFVSWQTLVSYDLSHDGKTWKKGRPQG